MPQAPRSGGDCEKTPTSAPSREDLSSSDERTFSASWRVACALQRHYDKARDVIMPKGHRHWGMHLDQDHITKPIKTCHHPRHQDNNYHQT